MNTKPFENHESEIRGYCRAYPTVFESATNARMVDEDGKSYIDFFAGAGVLNFGHNDERMKRAMIAFLEADGVAQQLKEGPDFELKEKERTCVLSEEGIERASLDPVVFVPLLNGIS